MKPVYKFDMTLGIRIAYCAKLGGTSAARWRVKCGVLVRPGSLCGGRMSVGVISNYQAKL
jgi:hypothetical protein